MSTDLPAPKKEDPTRFARYRKYVKACDEAGVCAFGMDFWTSVQGEPEGPIG